MASFLWLVRSMSLAIGFSPGLRVSRTIIKKTHAPIYCGEENSIGFPSKGTNPHSLPSTQIKSRMRVHRPLTLHMYSCLGGSRRARSQDAGFNPALLEDIGTYFNLLWQQVL